MTVAESMSATFAAERQRLLHESIPATALSCAAVVSIYAAADAFTRPQPFGPWSGVYLVQLLVPLTMLWLGRGPLRRHAEAVLLASELAFTGALLSHLLVSEAAVSGTAMMIALKLVVTALFLPWHPRTQLTSAVITLSLYLALVVAGGHLDPAGHWLHQALGPGIAAVLSCIGAAHAERTRRFLFERNRELDESRAQVRSLLEDGPDGIIVAERGFVDYANGTMCALLGHASSDALLGRHLTELVAMDAHIALDRYLAELGSDDTTPVHFDTRLIRADGSAIDVALNGRRIWSHGRPAVQIMARDSSEQRRMERERAATLAVHRALAEVGQELIASLGDPNQLGRLSRLTARVLGADASHTFLWDPELRCYSLAAGHGGQRYVAALRELKLPAEASHPFVRALYRDHAIAISRAQNAGLGMVPIQLRFDVEHALYIGLWRGDELVGVQTVGYTHACETDLAHRIEIARGIGQLGSLALEQTRLIGELEAANRVKSDFVATMSHELRTPLNVILGYNDLLLEEAFGPVTTEQVDTLERVRKNARELLDLINATLDLSRLEDGEVGYDWRDVHVPDLVRTIDSETRATGLKPGLRLAWDVEDALPPLRTDPLKLQVVLKNLINNAIKFTERGSVTVRIGAEGDGVSFAVCDTGIGIPPAAQEAIFEPFRQAEPSISSRFGGAGLGLHIVARLLRLLEGAVSVDSTPGVGSTFRVWIPNCGTRPVALTPRLGGAVTDQTAVAVEATA